MFVYQRVPSDGLMEMKIGIQLAEYINGPFETPVYHIISCNDPLVDIGNLLTLIDHV